MSANANASRRAFLRYSALASAGAVIPAFLDNTVNTVVGQQPESTPGRRRDPIPGFRDDRVLVVVQLGGGNDGLNALPPFGDDAYYRARPQLGVPQGRVLKVNDYFGFHEQLEPLKGLYDDGLVAVVNGVGYPNPNRSHFRSMEIWHTASDSGRYETDGWIGRYFDNCCQGSPDTTCAVNLGDDLPQAFDGMGYGVGFRDPNRFAWVEGLGRDTEERFRQLNHVAAGAHPADSSSLDFLRHVTSNIVLSSDRVKAASREQRERVRYPGGRLTQPLNTIAGLIAAEMPTRIYYCGFSGFDTHAGQQGAHENLLAQFAGSVKAFYDDLRRNGQADRVLIMAFSEFGRRVEENGSRGTDHGTAGPLFLIGNPVKGGAYGQYPSLTDLDRNRDLKHHVDFRQVYASVLEDWFDVRHASVLRRQFQTLDLIR